MFVRLPIKFCSTAIKEIGVVLSEDLLEVSTEKRKIDIPALALQNNDQTFIKKQYDWQEVSAVYKANGGEKYIAIGNFSNINEDAFNNRQENECTYIFIDLVSVSEFKEIQLPSFSIDMSLKKGERILLTEVTFEEGSNVLKESSFEILNDVMKILKENPKMKIEISSHSDNSLDGMKSLTFTKARAEKIIEHLTNKGALETQLIGVGRGSTNAIALNNSVNGRKKNDRIEMRILEL